MEQKYKYSDADFQLRTIAEFKNMLTENIERCKNFQEAGKIKTELLEEFNMVCMSKIVFGFLNNEADKIISEKFGKD